ncbi:MAG: hypothetical protein JW731_16770, partial [Bacteroidales bacterium]|nr:hypothetical protein [Bacteroidales bacterium]
INHICVTQFQEQKNSCCSATSKLEGATDGYCQNSHNCCKTDFKLLKTDFSYYKVSNNHFSFNPQIYFNITDISEINEDQEIYTNKEEFDDLPPPLYGREFLIKMHQLKIASPLA